MTDHFLRSLGDIQEEQEARLEREMDPDMALVSDYVTGELSEEQARAVRERIATDADFRDLAEPLLIAAEHGPRFQPIPREQLERKWLELRRRIGLPDLARDPRTDPSLDGFRNTIRIERRRARRNWVLGIAAMILMALLPQAIDTYRDIRGSFRHSTEWGRTELVALPDGSSALLASRSKLVGRGSFGRWYQLTGEATFDVTRHDVPPFFVTTESAAITVTGTRFTVHAYPNDATTLTVHEGTVEIRSRDRAGQPVGQPLVVTAGKRARAVRGSLPEIIP